MRGVDATRQNPVRAAATPQRAASPPPLNTEIQIPGELVGTSSIAAPHCNIHKTLHKCDKAAFMQNESHNPFTPTFGFAPHVLIGRDGLLSASDHALGEVSGSSGFSQEGTDPAEAG